ncbi:MAG: universal stress protein [Pseudomonadota bacterium]
MSIVTLFARRDETDDAGLSYAANLAATLERPLKAISALPDASSVYSYSAPEFAIGVSTVVAKEIVEAQENLLRDSRAAFDRIVAASDLQAGTATFEERAGFPADVAGDEATLADAIVFPRAAAKPGHGLSPACEHVMMDASLPLVIAGTDGRVAGPVLVAWDGSDESARAVRGFFPLMASLGKVIIAQNESQLGRAAKRASHDPARLQDWLKAKGIASERAALNGQVGEGLLTLAENMKAALIVSGAYGHSRAGERLFGGVTRTLLTADQAPALALCH